MRHPWLILAPGLAFSAALLMGPVWTGGPGLVPGQGVDLAHSLVVHGALVRGGAELSALAHSGALDLPHGSDLLTRFGVSAQAILGAWLASGWGLRLGFVGAIWGTLWLAGLGAAGLARHTLGRTSSGLPWPALAAGIAWQASAGLGADLASGAAHRLWAGALLPCMLWAWSRALEGGRMAAVSAGVAWVLAAMAWPQAGAVGAVAAVWMAGSRAGQHGPGSVLAALGTASAAALALGAVGLGWLWAGAGLVPGALGDPVPTALGLVDGWTFSRAQGLLGAPLQTTMTWLPAPWVGLLGLLGWCWARPQTGVRWAPIAALGLVFALGPGLHLAEQRIPLPGAAWLSLPGRVWTPLAFLALVELALVLGLAAVLDRGGRWRWFGPVALGGVLAGALWVGPRELPTTPWPRADVDFLAVAGPVVLIPAPGGPQDPEAQGLLDMAWLGVPVVNGPVPPGHPAQDGLSAPIAAAWPLLGDLARLGAPTVQRPLDDAALGSLATTGAVAVVADLAALSAAGEAGARMQARLAPVLGPLPVSGRYWVARLTPGSGALVPGAAPSTPEHGQPD